MEVEVTGGGAETERDHKKIVPFPLEGLQDIFKFFGPLDLYSCRCVSRAWREEVKVRGKVLKTYYVDSMETLTKGIELLKAGPGRSPLIIQELRLSMDHDEEFDLDFLREFLRSSSGPSLGKLYIWDVRNQLGQNDVQGIMERNPNLVHLDLGNSAPRTHFDWSPLFQGPMADGGPRYFPAIRKVKMLNYACSLPTILRACPNLSSLFLGRLEAPYFGHVDGSNLKRMELKFIDYSTCVQLRDMNLGLSHFTGTFSTDCRHTFNVGSQETMLRLIKLFRQFLETQAPTLQLLSLIYQGDTELWTKSDLFPCLLPHLTELTITMKLVSDFNQVLASVPRLDVLHLHSQGVQEEMEISSILPTRVINDHLGIKKLKILFQIKPHELSLMGTAFKNLSKLTLNEVLHGQLFMVYTELTQLNVLHIYERIHIRPFRSHVALHDTDFTGTHYPRSPYIGRMRNLKELEILFNFRSKSRDSNSSPFITDSILTHGIFDIVTQLTRLVIDGAKFSTDALKQLDSFMKPVWNDREVSNCIYVYKNV